MRFKYLYSFYFRNISRDKLYLTASVTLIVFLITRIIMYMNTWFEQENFGQLPAEIVVIVQTISILFMINFYRIFANELRFGIHNFFTDGYKILIEKITGLLLVHISFQIILTFLIYAVFSVVYFFLGIEWSMLYIDLFRFLIDYMFFPLFISALIGVITALIFGANKISVFFILLFWFFAGVINQEIFYSFFSTVESNDWKSLLSIGPNNIYTVYKSYIGFDLSIGLELKLFTWLFMLILILLLASTKWIIIKREKMIVLSIILLLSFLSFGIGYLSLHQNDMAFSNGDLIHETTNYKQMNPVDTNLNYTINQYNIELNGDVVRAELNFDSTNTNNPSFQLYHAYPIQKVMVDGKEVTYSREGDIIHINTNTDNFENMVFNYELTDTNLVPYTKKRTLLLANHAWYPKKRKHHVYENDLHTGSIAITESVPRTIDESYSFRLKADDLLFTNINAQNNYYEGETSALSIIKGQGNSLTYNNYDILYPADWPKMSKRIQEVIDRLETVFDEINRIIPMKVDSLPPKIVFTNEESSSFMNNEHLIYTTSGSSLAINDEEAMKDFEKTLMELTIEPKGRNEMFQEWINMSVQMIKREKGFHVYEPGPTIDILETNFKEEVGSIHSKFNSLDIEEKRNILEQWYTLMDDSWTWEDVKLLVEEGEAN